MLAKNKGDVILRSSPTVEHPALSLSSNVQALFGEGETFSLQNSSNEYYPNVYVHKCTKTGTPVPRHLGSNKENHVLKGNDLTCRLKSTKKKKN